MTDDFERTVEQLNKVMDRLTRSDDYQRGREQERAAVVAWLRSDACIWMVGGDIANEIEAEEHLK